jgi:hypothetical protein
MTFGSAGKGISSGSSAGRTTSFCCLSTMLAFLAFDAKSNRARRLERERTCPQRVFQNQLAFCE